MWLQLALWISAKNVKHFQWEKLINTKREYMGQPAREPVLVLVLVVAVDFVDIVHWTSANKYFQWE